MSSKNHSTAAGITFDEPCVWYVSPFGPSEWLALSSAERLLEVEYARWLAGDMLGTQPPCIVPREMRIAEIAARVRGVIDHVPKQRSPRDQIEGVTRCQRCARIIAKDWKPGFVQRNHCRAMKVRVSAK